MFSKGQQVINVRLFYDAEHKFEVYASVQPGVAIPEAPYQMNVTMAAPKKTVSKSFCTCQAE